MINFFHRLWNPHCEHCRDERENNRVCSSCETLKTQLEIANYDNRQMLQTILGFTKPVVETTVQNPEIEPIRPKAIPWSIRRNTLEAEDRVKAALMRQATEDAKEPVKGEVDVKAVELERELGVEQNG